MLMHIIIFRVSVIRTRGSNNLLAMPEGSSFTWYPILKFNQFRQQGVIFYSCGINLDIVCFVLWEEERVTLKLKWTDVSLLTELQGITNASFVTKPHTSASKEKFYILIFKSIFCSLSSSTHKRTHLVLLQSSLFLHVWTVFTSDNSFDISYRNCHREQRKINKTGCGCPNPIFIKCSHYTLVRIQTVLTFVL